MEKLKCVVISDTHMKHNEINFDDYIDCNTLIHAGDFCNKGTEMEVIHFLEWLEGLDFNNKILIAGNHDIYLERFPDDFELLIENIAPSVTYLMNASTIIDGIKFYGSPYSNEFCGWAFMEYDHDLQTIWNAIDLDTDVLISHGPAYMCHDLVDNAWSRERNVGSKALQIRKSMLPQLKAHVSGHIHSQHGTSITHGCTNICASICDEQYKATQPPIRLEI